MANTKLWDSIMKRIKKNKKLEIGIYIVIVLIAVLIYLSTLTPAEESSGDTPEDNVNLTSSVTIPESDVEQKLSKTLSGIKGAGNVEVMITYETSKEIVPALDTQSQESSSNGGDGNSNSESSSPATVNNNGETEPIVLTEIQPKVRGVIVVAQGAWDIGVKLDLQFAVQTVLGVSADCIEIFEMAEQP